MYNYNGVDTYKHKSEMYVHGTKDTTKKLKQTSYTYNIHDCVIE